jgi:hypothetical protein
MKLYLILLQVGVVIDDDALEGPQINSVFSSNRDLVLGAVTQRPFRSIPLTSHTPPTLPARRPELSQQQIASGAITHVHHGGPIPLQRQTGSVGSAGATVGSAFPLGGPHQQQHGQSRPDFFPPQNRPPIYRALPPKYEAPMVLLFTSSSTLLRGGTVQNVKSFKYLFPAKEEDF